MEKQIKASLRTKGYKTVSDAIVEYIENGGDGAFLGRVNEALGLIRLDEINQATIDQAARDAYPGYKRGKNGKPRIHSKATIKRQFYTPLASVLHHAHNIGWMPYIRVMMPKTERPAPKWADENWFESLFAHASDDLKRIVIFLTGTGCRISEVLNLAPGDVNAKAQEAYVRTTKNGEPRMVHLPEFVLEQIKPLLEDNRDRVFYMYNSRHNVNADLERTAKKAKIEYLTTHKVGSHTYATSLARLAGMDAKALSATGRWKDPKSTYFYTHYLKSEQSRKADSLKVLFKKDES